MRGKGRASGPLPLAVRFSTLVLPTVRGEPESSPQQFREDRLPARDGRTLTPWSVPAAVLSPAAAAPFLLALPGEAGSTPTAGDSLHFFSAVAAFALELVARGRVAPALVRLGDQSAARWRPVLEGSKDIARISRLARAMPPVCLAALAAALPSSDAVLDEILEAFADAFARSALAVPGASGPSGRARRPRPRRALVEDLWLAALHQPAGGFGAEPVQADRLAHALDAWSRPAFEAGRRSLMTCFSLVEPPEDSAGGEGDESAWRLEFLLQAVDDAAVVAPAARVWECREDFLRIAGRRLENPQETFLADLGRAVRLYPELETALREPRPEGLDLGVAGAHRFLSDAAALLEQAGFGVRVPAWWTAPTAHLGVRLATSSVDARTARAGGLGLSALCAYRWEIAVGNESLSLEEFRSLASRKAPLVRVRGHWVELREDQVSAALAFFRGKGRGGAREGMSRMPLGQALRIGLGLECSPAGLPVVGIEAQGWLAGLLAGGEDSRLVPVPTPKGFRGTLRPYQERGLAWLAFLQKLGLGACLADDMGLGKTIQLLALLLAEKEEDLPGDAGPTLLVCPMSVVGNWQRETERFAPSLRVHVHHGGDRLSGKAFARAVLGADLVLTTYGLAARDRRLLSGVRWSRIALDEAQNVKNPAAKQTRALRSLAAPRRVALTGTPVENRLGELWSILDFLNPSLLGGAAEFQSRYARPIERFGDDERAQELARVVRPFVLRRLKTDRKIRGDLPDKIEIKVYCNLTREQAMLYQAVVDGLLARIGASIGIQRKGLVLAALTHLKQVCNHPAHFLRDGRELAGRSGKLARLEEILDEVLAGSDKALVFTQYAEMGHLLRARLSERFSREVPFLFGGTAKKARDAMVERFQDPEGPRVLVASLRAGGTGLNLTAACHVVHYDRWWNPAVEDQATDRAFRIGQTKDVQVRKFISAGTLEEKIDRMIEEKRGLADRVVGTGEAWLTELSTDELREVLSLAADAVAEE